MLEIGNKSIGMEWKVTSIVMYIPEGMMRVMLKVF